MTNSNLPSIEDQLRAATRMPQPRPEFLNGLRSRIAAQPPKAVPLSERLLGAFRRPAWALSAILLVCMAVFLAAGPQRVLAALQSMLSFIPGVGFVSTENGMALREPVMLTQNERSVRVEQLLASAHETVLVLRLAGFPPYQPVGLDHHVTLTLPDGSWLQPHSYAIDATAQAGEYQGVFKFEALPAGTQQVELTWKQEEKPGQSGAAGSVLWQFSLRLQPVADSQMAGKLPVGAAPSNASASDHGITLMIDQASIAASGIALRLQIFAPAVFDYVLPSGLTLVDDGGKTYPNRQGQVHFEDQGQPIRQVTLAPASAAMLNLHQTVDFPALQPGAKPSMVHVDQLDFRAAPAFKVTIQPGVSLADGAVFPVDQGFTVGDLSFRVKNARLVAFAPSVETYGKAMVGLVLEIEPAAGSSTQLTQLWLKAPGALSIYDPAGKTWAPAWEANALPTTIDLSLEMIQGVLKGDWELRW